ncbi:MAG: metalloregulator ArsR/SmtB family transcription factor [Fimbriimonadaceae bacterium]|jgi:DNA-binding transcriptional ArsR family regulator|nr:metalloregulator ArsR/SmtB family transcription factor [Fimbriimonadaceae bacterium]
MVEQEIYLNNMFHALADSTRRDILARVGRMEQSIGDLARAYSMSFAAIAKHIDVLVRAQLVRKQRRGKYQVVSLNPEAVGAAQEHLERYAMNWNQRFDQLEHILTSYHKPAL